MRIIKRSGEEQEFNPKKISVAIGKANGSVTKDKQFPENYIPAYTAQAVAAAKTLVTRLPFRKFRISLKMF